MALQCVLKLLTAHGIKEVPASSVSWEVRLNLWNSLFLLTPFPFNKVNDNYGYHNYAHYVYSVPWV